MQQKCPSCQTIFECGVDNKKKPCACGEISLNDAQRAFIAKNFEGCLCLNCLVVQQKRYTEQSAKAQFKGKGN